VHRDSVYADSDRNRLIQPGGGLGYDHLRHCPRLGRARGGLTGAAPRRGAAAAALNRQFIRYERHWSRKHRGPIGDDMHLEYMRDLDASQSSPAL